MAALRFSSAPGVARACLRFSLALFSSVPACQVAGVGVLAVLGFSLAMCVARAGLKFSLALFSSVPSCQVLSALWWVCGWLGVRLFGLVFYSSLQWVPYVSTFNYWANGKGYNWTWHVPGNRPLYSVALFCL